MKSHGLLPGYMLSHAKIRDRCRTSHENHSIRNLKQINLAFKYYKRSIELNPRHRGAHEYIGEGYLMVGDLANAEKHLTALRNICLLPCDEFAKLEKAIKEYRARKK